MRFFRTAVILAYWSQNLISTSMNPNTPVTEIELNSLHCIFLRYSVHTISGHMDSLTYGHTRNQYTSGTEDFWWRLHKNFNKNSATFTSSSKHERDQWKRHVHCNGKLTLSSPVVSNVNISKCSGSYWSNPLFWFFDIRALWHSGLSARVPKSQKIKMVG